jgi:hypothetical protein
VDEIRAPATLVDAALHAIADVGSIPTVSMIFRKAARVERFLRIASDDGERRPGD